MSQQLSGSYQKKLQTGLEQIGLALSMQQQNKLLEFVTLLHRWNQKYNLTAIKNIEDMLTKHIFDSLVVRPYLCPGSALDLGTGAGLPGIPLAISSPDIRFTLLDSIKKKITFVRHAIATLQLDNAKAEHARLELQKTQVQYDCILARAVTSLENLAKLTKRSCKPGGVIIAMKGEVNSAELELLPDFVQVQEVVTLKVPGLEGHSRHVVILQSI